MSSIDGKFQFECLPEDIARKKAQEEKVRHACDAPKKAKTAGYGEAIDGCSENIKDWNNEKIGEFWVGNGEYASQVNYCPYCGAKAPVQIET